MDNGLIGVGISLLTFLGMEAASWTIHKYVFHGPLWFIHRTHHRPNNGPFEANDLFSLGFGLTAMILIWQGLEAQDFRFWMGAGITAYGLVYFWVHDVLAHRRLKLWKSSKFLYLRAVVRAHKMHHKHLQKEGSEAFGLLYVAKKYLDQVKRN